MTSTDNFLASFFGYVRLAALALIMVPQMVHNAKRQSVEGLSFATIALWLFGSTALTVLLIVYGLEVSLIAANLVYLAGIGVVTFQLFYYQQHALEVRTSFPHALLRTTALLLIEAALATLYALALARCGGSQKTLLTLLELVPSVCVGVGFLPQIYSCIQKRSTKGISSRLIVLDLVGAASGLLSLSFSGVVVWTSSAGIFCFTVIFLELVLTSLVIAFR